MIIFYIDNSILKFYKNMLRFKDYSKIFIKAKGL